MADKYMIWLKWELEIPQAQKLRLRVEINLFSISSAATPCNNSYIIYEIVIYDTSLFDTLLNLVQN